MNLDHLDGRKKSGVDLDRADSKVASLLARLPDGYRILLSLSDGVELVSGALIYGSRELVERNETYDVAACLPGHVAIGDDGGGRMFLLLEGMASPVLRIDMGAIGSMTPEIVAANIETWIDQGCPSQTPADMREEALPSFADVVLVALPGGKLANLIAIKNELGLDLGMSELKALTAALPACLVKNVPYGKFRKRCEALNARFGACLSLRTK